MNRINLSKIVALYLALIVVDSVATLAKSEDRRMLDVIALQLMDYRRTNNGLPVGSNIEIAKALKAFDSKRAPDALKTSSSGELIDSRGKPIVVLCSHQGWALVGTLNEEETRLDEYVLIPPSEVVELYLEELETEDEGRSK